MTKTVDKLRSEKQLKLQV